MGTRFIFAGLLLASFAFAAVAAEEEEEKKELEGYSVGSTDRPSFDSDDMKIEIERPTFDSSFKVDKPKPSMQGIRMERPKLQVVQSPARPDPAGSGSAASAADDSAPARSSGGETRSIEPVRMDPPDYPRNALRRGQEGYVVVQFTIGTDGETQDIEVVDSDPRGVFDSEAKRAVSRWEFKPALRDGRPVETRLKHTIDFTLE